MKSTNYTNSIKINRKVIGIIGALFTLIIPYFLLLFNKNDHLATDQSLCPFKMITGFPCAGCGITKSLVYLYNGDLYRSVSYHVLGPFVVVFCIVTIIVLTTELITHREYFSTFLYNKKIAYVLGFLLMGYHMIRLTLFISNNTISDILKESIWK